MRWFPLGVILSLSAACHRSAPVREVSVAEAAARINAGAATPVDANTDEYRQAAGWIPGAVLLTDFAEYPVSELPADRTRPLIFYCTSRL